MAQFRAVIQGQRGEASRLGSKSTGLRANINGWNSGVEVEAVYNEQLKRDEFFIYASGGSNGSTVNKIASVYVENGEVKTVLASCLQPKQ